MSAWLCWLQWVATSSPPYVPPMYLRRDGDLADRSSFEGREDPPGHGGGVSPRPLYSAAFSASQTSFLTRDGAMSGPFSPIPNDVALERSILPMDQHTRQSYGLALSSGLETTPSCPGTRSSFSSLAPSTNDSMGFIVSGERGRARGSLTERPAAQAHACPALFLWITLLCQSPPALTLASRKTSTVFWRLLLLGPCALHGCHAGQQLLRREI